uniref:Secreted protein n=1 Tax=Knipowitschia caucasica TaxID=637954 RepID=A0AAV2LB04_KNICA
MRLQFGRGPLQSLRSLPWFLSELLGWPLVLWMSLRAPWDAPAHAATRASRPNLPQSCGECVGGCERLHFWLPSSPVGMKQASVAPGIPLHDDPY